MFGGARGTSAHLYVSRFTVASVITLQRRGSAAASRFTSCFCTLLASIIRAKDLIPHARNTVISVSVRILIAKISSEGKERNRFKVRAVILDAVAFVGVLRTPHHNCRRLSDWKRSEEHTSELQSRGHLVCRLLLEKKN